MLLKTLKLENIRSYVIEKIDFPEGTVLLAGDIGAGKSTILLAVEFALFGLMRSELSGNSLLRHGAKTGSVELTFSLNNTDIIIQRALKRSKNSVEQSAGWIIRAGQKQNLTPTELKSIILDILGYPKELLTKSKSMIYRYTVYTPQEEMKKILFEDTETRLNILRKVFNIDKYKRIKENAGTYAKALRDKKKIIEAGISDEQQKKQELENLEKQLSESRQQISAVQPQVDACKKLVEEKRRKTDELEQKQKAFSGHRQELAAANAELNALTARKLQLQKEKQQLEQDISRPPDPAENPSVILQSIARQDEELKLASQAVNHHNAKIGELEGQKKHCEKIINEISQLDKCPTCRQDVCDAHKSSITGKEKQKLAEVTGLIAETRQKLSAFEQKQSQTQAELSQLRQKHSQAIIANEKQKQFEQNRQKTEQVKAQILQTEERQKLLETKKQDLSTLLQGSSEAEQMMLAAKKELDEALQKQQQVIIRHTRLSEQQKHTLMLVERLKKELSEKQKAREQADKLNRHHTWLADFFVPLMDSMEKHVMAQVYTEFDDLFRKWLEILIEGEVLTAKLDDTFTPLIQQNGYDADYSGLSGGEKTACALAYRLALNKVINDLIDTIHTRDVLILDEPTDGFSADQLDRMRDVLEQLNCRQVILVSHEAKIETMVDKVLRVTKEAHISRIS